MDVKLWPCPYYKCGKSIPLPSDADNILLACLICPHCDGTIIHSTSPVDPQPITLDAYERKSGPWNGPCTKGLTGVQAKQLLAQGFKSKSVELSTQPGSEDEIDFGADDEVGPD